MNYLPFRSHSLPVKRQRQWFEQHLKFEKVIHLLLQTCILQMMPLPCAHSYDAVWGLSQNCKNHCDNHRRPGWKGWYTLDCKQAYSTLKDIDLCTNLCSECPSDLVLDRKRPHILSCPETELEGTCGDFCNENHKFELGIFIIDCKKKFTNNLEISRCKDACAQCPSWVCNTGTSTFHCPAPHRRCENVCNRFRDEFKKYDDSEAFQFSCDDLEDSSFYKNKCKIWCEVNCPEYVCQKDNLSSENRKWNCPGKSSPENLQKTYKGACKNRCDKYRSGGTGSYTLDCSSLFKPGSGDEMKCEYDCDQCPENVCRHGSFYCPEADNHVDWESKFDALKGFNDTQASEITIAVIFAVILAILFTVMASGVYCQIRRGRLGRAQGGVLANPEAIMSTEQQIQHQPSQM